MKYEFSVCGHGWNRDFFYADGDGHQVLSCPGGARLVSEILEKSGHTVAPLDVSGPVLTEHIALERQSSGAFSCAKSYGVTPGASQVGGHGGEVSVLWDEGLESIPVPATGRVLWTSRVRLPEEGAFDPVKDRALLMLSCDVLRNSGALISRQISWERTATELTWQLKHNPKFQYLDGVADMLITFAEDGAIHIRRQDGGMKAQLTLLHGGFEGQVREQSGLNVPDAWAAMVAAAALAWKAQTAAPLDVASILRPGAQLQQSGYVPELIKNADYGAWLDCEERGGAHTYRVPVSESKQQPDPTYWSTANTFGGSKMQDLAFSYVLEGAKVIEGIPRFTCGNLTTIDRREIEAFHNIRGLIVDYAAGSANRPLSIAVFGAPGSGKSFGVTQIAKAVLPGVAEKLEFNVSQMTSPSDIAAAFHQVRDVVLSGKLPIAFFDEFDSDRDGRPLGWLKSFLMPMQDGKFRDDSGEHPVGKCILVFAGGTASSFEGFCQPMTPQSEPSVSQAFKGAKGPDFVSRLRGAIDVLGPNPSSPTDQSYLLRRALLLRSLLERKLRRKGSLPVSPDVLRAMLLVPKFKHGARSMEAVLDMSHMDGASWEPVSLPFYAQLALHVDADAFIRLVLRDVVLSAYNELLAKAIHEDYLAKAVHEDYLKKQNQRKAKASPNQIPWDQLGDEGRKSSREQALDIPNKLLTVGCAFDAGDAPHPTLEAFTTDEILRLAQDEHIRWMAQKSRDGWRYASVRDDRKKLHPCLVNWEDLPEDEKQKDVDAAQNIIPLLKKAGLRVYRMI